jgi:hypothetical protein
MGADNFLQVMLSGLGGSLNSFAKMNEQKMANEQALELAKAKKKENIYDDVMKAIIIEQAKGLNRKGQPGFTLDPAAFPSASPELISLAGAVKPRTSSSVGKTRTSSGKPSIFGNTSNGPKIIKISR